MAVGLLDHGRLDHPAYLNWDVASSRAKLRYEDIPTDQPLIVLDEIHKYARWRRLVKGLYDQYAGTRQFLITGSARLDYYRKGGDSLQGRYHYYRLHPFSLREINSTPTPSDTAQLLRFGGFPEPLFSAKERDLRCWIDCT